MPFGLPGIGTSGGPVLPGIGAGPKTGGGAKLIKRIISTGGAPAKTITVPAKTGWIRIGATGSGTAGYRDGGATYHYGGGGAYAYNDGPVAPGASVNISSIGNESGVSITVGAITCSAVSGGAYITDGADILGGNASDCVGKITRSGGKGGASQYSTGATAGQNGGAAGAAGGAGGDTDYADGLGFNGNGAGGVSGNGYPGIGGGGTWNGYTGSGSYGGAAGYIIEFWTSDPRAS